MNADTKKISDNDLRNLFSEAAKDAFTEAKAIREDIDNPKSASEKVADKLDNFVKTMYQIASKKPDFSTISSESGLNFASIISDLMNNGMSKKEAVMAARNESRNYIEEKYGVVLPDPGKAPAPAAKKSFTERILQEKSQSTSSGIKIGR